MTGLAGYVYCITNKINGKSYVGCTNLTIKRRWCKHLSEARLGSSRPLHAALRKYGARNFSLTCVEKIEGHRKDLLEAERRVIRERSTLVPDGYNLTIGGEGVVLVGEAKQRQREASAKVNKARAVPGTEWYRRTAEANRKRAEDPEWLKRCAEAAEGRYASQEWLAANTLGITKREENRRSRDALLPPEELARRLSGRIRMRRSVEKKRVLASGGIWVPPTHGNTITALERATKALAHGKMNRK